MQAEFGGKLVKIAVGKGRPITPPTPFGRNLRHWREKRDISQGKLAELLGLKVLAVSRWETREKVNPSLDTICRIAGVLDCEPADLLAGVDPVV